jgi:predicted ATPase
MATLRVQNIGPIIDTGNIELTQILLITGRQGSGKSTFMKILCFCSWVEKQVMINEKETLAQYTHYGRFLKELKQFHRLHDTFFSAQSSIEYHGDCVNISMQGAEKNAKIERLPRFEDLRHNLKLSYIPSERNLVAAIKNVDKAYRSTTNDILFNYLFEWGEVRESYTKEHPHTLRVASDVAYYYNASKGEDTLRLNDSAKEFTTFYASSGIQSALPIEVMIDHFTALINQHIPVSKSRIQQIMSDKRAEDKNWAVNELSKYDQYRCVKYFVEEPEQNLYPESQKQLLLTLAATFIKSTSASSYPSSLVLTTHSPYIVSVINVIMRASRAYSKDSQRTRQVLGKEFPIGAQVGAHYLTDGKMTSLIDAELPMVSGVELDSVSEWVEDKIADLNDIIYG